MKKRTNLAAFLVVLLFACAADGLMDQLGPVGFTLAGTAVMGTAWGLVEYKEAKRMIQTWYRRNGEWIPERPLEPADDAPLRYCTRCGGEIYNGTDTLCDGCLEETGGRKGMLEYMEAYPDVLLSFLKDYQDEDFLDGFFGAFYERYEFDFERWRRT